jgi:GIY-YIG catalytic domain/NUMOD3 motif
MGAFVYILTFSNGKQYVGQTRRSVDERMKEHRYDMARGIKRKLYDAWRELGEPAREVVECSLDELDALECATINRLGCRSPNGYNAIPGGGFLPQLDPEIAARIAETHRTAPHLLAKIRRAQRIRWEKTTPEERSAWMEAVRPHHQPHTAETKAKISAALKGKLKGVPKSVQHIANVAAANRGKKRSPEQIERIRQGAIRGHLQRGHVPRKSIEMRI